MTKSQKSKKPQFAARKKAFDAVLEAYRSAKDVTGGIGAAAIGEGGKGVSNPVKPSLTDFRCDVDRVINKCVPESDKVMRLRFRLAYIEFDSENPIDMEVMAEKVIGSGRHNLEQGMGAEFIKRGLYPLHGKRGYFHTIRQPRGSV
jgi:hypothetical protein